MLSDEDKQWFCGLLSATQDSMAQRFDKMAENMEAMFRGWSLTYEVRARGTSGVMAELNERPALVEQRLARLERGRI